MTSPGRDAGDAAGSDQRTRSPQLSRELGDFLVELSIAMHKHAIYPPGHPLLVHADDAVYGTLLELLATRPVLSIGVARRQLIIEGVATESVHPLLRELSGKLHRHHIGALKFMRGVTREELSDALGTVGIEPQRHDTPLGLQTALVELRWARVKLFPLTYDRLELLDDNEDDPEGARAAGSRDGRAAQLWVGLASAAIAGDRTDESSDSALEPVAVAHAIDVHSREQAYDQVIVGYLLQIADEVRRTGPSEGAGLKRRISQLVGALQPATLERLLEMGGDSAQRRRFVLDAAQGMNVDAVVDLVQAAAQAEGQTISHSLVRMLTKLASHATETESRRGIAADGALRDHVTRLVGAWSLDDPNPVAYSAALETIAHGAHHVADREGEARHACEPTRLVYIALALGVTGASVRRATEAALAAGGLGDLLDALDAWPDAATAANAVWETIAAAAPLRALLAAPQLDVRVVQRVVRRTGVAAVVPLLDALGETADPVRREQIVARVASIGPAAIEVVAQQLAGSEPVRIRELLALLARLAPTAPPPEVRGFLTHADPLVRREVVRLLAAHEATREPALLAAVLDTDARVLAVGLLEAQARCSPRVAVTIRQRLDRGEIDDDIQRGAAVRAVAAMDRAGDETVGWLLQRVLRTSRVLRREKLAPPTAEMLAALAALAMRWGSDPRTQAAIELARTHEDAAIRNAVSAPRPSRPTPLGIPLTPARR